MPLYAIFSLSFGVNCAELHNRVHQRFIGDVDIAIHCCLNACMTQQLLKYLRLNPCLNGSGGIGVAESVHTEPFDSRLIAQLIQVGIIGAVLGRLTSSPIYENQVAHDKAFRLASPPFNVLQNLRQNL